MTNWFKTNFDKQYVYFTAEPNIRAIRNWVFSIISIREKYALSIELFLQFVVRIVPIKQLYTPKPKLVHVTPLNALPASNDDCLRLINFRDSLDHLLVDQTLWCYSCIVCLSFLNNKQQTNTF